MATTLDRLEWMADLLNVELHDLICNTCEINTDVLHEVNPNDWDDVARFHRICKNSVKMDELMKRHGCGKGE